jgi:hypothetical protein
MDFARLRGEKALARVDAGGDLFGVAEAEVGARPM